MVEFTRRNPEPPELTAFREASPTAGPSEFSSIGFHSIKLLVKQKLNEDQFGLCAYCESALSPADGQIDHVKPKGGLHARPDLTFAYENYVHGCCHQPKHCGQKKGDKLLPIEPGPLSCNEKFVLCTNGDIGPKMDLSRQEKHLVCSVRDMLGLNYSSLRVEREKWVAVSLELLRFSAEEFESFIANKPYRFILRRLAS